MNSRKAVFVIILALLLSSCSSLEAYFDQSSVTIVSPQDGQRFTDMPLEGQTYFASLTLRLTSNYEGPKVVRVYINDLGPTYCTLYPDIEKDCYQIPVIRTGNQTIRVEMDIMDGDSVYRTQTYITTFSWVPYDGWWDLTALKLAKVLHRDTPASGYRLFALTLMTCLSLAGYFLSRRSVIASLLGGWSSLVILAIIYAFSGSIIAQSIAWGLVTLAVLTAIFGFVGYHLYSIHERGKHTVPLPRSASRNDFDNDADEGGGDVIDVTLAVVNSGEYLPSPQPPVQSH